MRSFRKILAICIILCIFCIAGIAGAQSLETIKAVKLDTTKLTLAVGKNYTFFPAFTVENPAGIYNQKLLLFSTDENVVQVVDEEVNTITAVGKGTAKIYAYAEGYTASSVCTVTVTGKASNAVSPVAWTKPDSKVLAKVQDPALKAFFTLLAKSDMKNNAGNLAQNTWFKTIITLPADVDQRVIDEKINSINDNTELLKNWHHLSMINSLAIQGTAAGYQELLKESFVLSVKADPISVTMGDTGDDMLEGMSEALSHFSEAEWMTGEGSYVVILDTGAEDGHEQLEGKVSDQACFSSYVEGGDTFAVCRGENSQFNDEDSFADEIALRNTHVFNHGTFVAAIAAGKNGVAKDAQIISLNVFSDKVFRFQKRDREGNKWYEDWHTAASYASDQMRALEYFLDKYDNDPVPVAAVNMSFGNGKETKACTTDIREPYYQMLLDRGIVPVTASGSNGWDGAVSNPACSPSTFAVGALWDSADPEVAAYSNHSPLVNIMAPGTFILSATAEEPNEYRNWDGTSFAAPMVSGAIARLRQVFPNAVLDPQGWNRMTAGQLETLMTGIAVRSAERKKVSVPVLDINALDAFMGSMDNLYKYQGVYGGTKQLRINYKKLSFNNNYTIDVYPANNDGSVAPNQKPAATVSGKNLPENVIVKNLNNGKLYKIHTRVELALNSTDEPFVLENDHYGMPMDPLPAGECEIKLIRPANDEDDPQFEFKWNNNNKGNYEHWVMWASAVDDHIDFAEHSNNWTTHARWDRPISADFHKVRYMNLKDGNGENYVETLFSEGTTLDAFPLRKPMWAQWRVRNGRCWLGYDEMPPMLTAREVVIDQLKVDANGNVIRDNKGNPTVEKNLKTLKADVKKYPNDIVITGLPDDVPMRIKVRTLADYNKKPYTSDWWTVGYQDGDIYRDDQWSWTPVYIKEDEEYPGFEGLITGVGISTGDKTATVSYDKDFTVDGMRFEIKPIEPNHTKFVQEALISKNPTSYTISDLNNGWVYKLRMQQTVKAGKGSVRSTFFPGKWIEESNDQGETWLSPDFAPRPEDTAWLGITFVPLPAPQADYRTNAYDNDTRRELRVIADNAADGFALVEIGKDNDAFVERIRWWEGQPDGEPYYISDNDTDLLDPASPNRAHVIMLWKEWDGVVYYGPAVYMDLVNQWPGEPNYPDYITTGPKSPDMIDLSSIPELSDAAQIDGQVSLSYYDSVSKGIDEYPEIKLLDINAITEEDLTEEPEGEAEYTDVVEVYAADPVEEEIAAEETAEETVDETEPIPDEKSDPMIPGMSKKDEDDYRFELFYLGY